MKKFFVFFAFFVFLYVPLKAGENIDLSPEADNFIYGAEPQYDTDENYYFSVTRSPDFKINTSPARIIYKKNEIFTDFKVNLVETIPFGFSLGYIGLFITRMIEQKTFTPKIEDISKYPDQSKNPVIWTTAGLVALTSAVNFIWYYDYKGPNTDAQKDKQK